MVADRPGLLPDGSPAPKAPQDFSTQRAALPGHPHRKGRWGSHLSNSFPGAGVPFGKEGRPQRRGRRVPIHQPPGVGAQGSALNALNGRGLALSRCHGNGHISHSPSSLPPTSSSCLRLWGNNRSRGPGQADTDSGGQKTPARRPPTARASPGPTAALPPGTGG